MLNPGTTAKDATSVDPQADPTGLILAGRYQLEARIGMAGVGAVYRAIDTETHERVAVKVFDAELSKQPQYARQFERVAEAAERIRHPNIARSLARGQLADGQLYTVSEFIRGQNLKAALAHGPFAVSRAVSIARQVARALLAAHSAGIVHRDLKPENIMLAVDDRPPASSSAGVYGRARPNDDVVKILGFGVAKRESPRGTFTSNTPLRQTDATGTTPDYISPEQAAGLPVDARSDLYSAGVIFYELVAGRTPSARGETLVNRRAGHVQSTSESLPAHVPTALVSVISRLLSKDPAQRFATAEQLLAALDKLDRNSDADGLQLPPSSRAGGVTRTAPPGTVRPPAIKRRRGPLGLQGRGIGLWVAGCLLAVLGSAVVIGYRGTTKPTFEATPGAQFHAAAALGDKTAMAQLSKLPEPERTGTDWLALAQGYEANGKNVDAANALGRALTVEPELAPNPSIRILIWQLLTTPPRANTEVAAPVVHLTRQHLGEHAPDLLLALAVNDALSSDMQQVALNALQPIAEDATEAVQIALETSRAPSCQHLLELSERIMEHGDVRTASVLSDLDQVLECPPSGICGQCVAQSEQLTHAKSVAAARPAPQLDFM